MSSETLQTISYKTVTRLPTLYNELFARAYVYFELGTIWARLPTTKTFANGIFPWFNSIWFYSFTQFFFAKIVATNALNVTTDDTAVRDAERMFKLVVKLFGRTKT